VSSYIDGVLVPTVEVALGGQNGLGVGALATSVAANRALPRSRRSRGGARSVASLDARDELLSLRDRPSARQGAEVQAPTEHLRPTGMKWSTTLGHGSG
jgi:hypothetical protein